MRVPAEDQGALRPAARCGSPKTIADSSTGAAPERDRRMVSSSCETAITWSPAPTAVSIGGLSWMVPSARASPRIEESS